MEEQDDYPTIAIIQRFRLFHRKNECDASKGACLLFFLSCPGRPSPAWLIVRDREFR